MANPTVVGTPQAINSAATYTAEAGSNRLVVAALFAKGSTAPTLSSVTWGGATPTTIVSVRDNAAGDRDSVTWVYWLESQIAGGAQTLTVSWSGASLELKNAMYTIQDADQTTVIRSLATSLASNFSGTVNMPITGLTIGDLCMGGGTTRNNITFTQNGGWTEDFDAVLSSGAYHAGHFTTAGTSDAYNITFSSASDTALGAFAIIGNTGGSPAVLSSATPSGTLGTATTATLGATTDQSSGTFYGVVDSGANITGISAAQVKAGQNNAGAAPVASGNASVSTTAPSAGMTGLTAATAYEYAVVQNNTNGDSNVLTGSFTTGAAASNPDYRNFGPQGAIRTLLTM